MLREETRHVAKIYSFVSERGHFATYYIHTVDEEKEHGDGEVASSLSIFIIGTCSKILSIRLIKAD